MISHLGRNANGEPLCPGTDWTKEPFVPSDLKEPRYIGGCSYITSYEEYDEEGSYEEYEYHKYEYFVLPDGSAKMEGAIEKPWQSGQFEKLTKTFAPGTWVCDPWTTWPKDFGSRNGVRVVTAR